MKNLFAALALVGSLVGSHVVADTSHVLSTANACKTVDTRNQAVDNYLDINYPMQWSSHTQVTATGDTDVFLYEDASSQRVRKSTVHMTIEIKAVGNRWKCQS